MPPRVAVIGSTASGKSSVAMAVAAERDDTDIISVDSMQVYRHMSIGTAKPTVEEQQSVRHHLIDIVEPSEEFT
ncbi:MAG: isopentenyl transferase family protein, partial [Actinomycetota bacterium]|nr:isopentenyl transferase family protein [Actinomycetota bacterium]